MSDARMEIVLIVAVGDMTMDRSAASYVSHFFQKSDRSQAADDIDALIP